MKKLFSGLLICCMAIFLLTTTVSAETTADGFSYNVLNGTYISITGYTGSDTEVIIPTSINGYIVQSIGSNAFQSKTDITNVVLPDSLESIGSYAFYGCSSLESVGFNEGLEAIGSYAFRYCTSLKSVELSNTVTTINSYVFSNCTNLTDISLPNTLETIGSNAFQYCTSLEDIVLPDSITTINNEAFNGCSKLTSVNYPMSWTTAGSNIFTGCTKLTNLTVPEGVTAIPNNAFYGCTNFNTINLPTTLKTIGEYAFSSCSGLTGINLNDGLETINRYAFRYCTGLQSVVIPETVTSIGTYAFQYCTRLESVEFANDIATLNSYMFSGCSGLTNVILPSTLKTISNNTFEGCTSLESIVLPDSITTINNEAFNGCSKLTSVNYPMSWTTAGSNIFAGCTKLTNLTVPEGVTAIPNNAFYGAPYFKTIILPTTLESIGSYSFAYCSGLFEINVPEGITTIPNNAFNGCISLNSIAFPSTLQTIGNYAFSDCRGLRLITLNAELVSIGQYAFSGCSGLISLVLNSELITLSNYSFASCTNLTAVTIPNNVTSIAGNSFNNSNKLTIYCYSGSAAHYVAINNGYNYFLLDAHDHEYAITVETEATCMRGGSQIHTCAICEYNYIEILQPLGHTPGEWMVVREANCTVDGEKIKRCTVCNDILETVVLSALGHSYVSNIVSATCMTQGHTDHTCSTCSHNYKDQYVTAPGHSYGTWNDRTIPTCTTTGQRYRVCSVCTYEDTQTVPSLGHDYSSEWTIDKEATCTVSGSKSYHCSRCDAKSNATVIPATGHSYGAWIIEQEATVLAEGKRYQVCSICSYKETEVIDKVYVDIANNDQYGLAVFTVVNAQTLEVISGAQIFISTEKDGENTFTTDSQGQARVVLPIGKQVVSVYASGCLTRNLNINIKAGVNEINKIGLSDIPTYDAEITSELMTIEEIEEAGIDTSDPSNQHVYKYELKLEFEPEIDVASIIAYFNADGKFLRGYSPDNAPSEPSEPGEPTYNLHYHVVNDGFWHSWCKNVEVDKGQNASLTYHPWRDNDDYVFDGWYEDEHFTKKISSVNIEEYTTYVYGRWIYIGEEETEPVVATSGIRVPVKDQIITVYPVNEYFYLIIRGEVTWLKEMFDVEMLVINNSMTDTLTDITATLELPEGLSLATMVGEQQTFAQEIDYIGEGKSKSVHWYVRGDTAGSYSLKARLQGMVMPFEEPIDDVFIAENQLQVWAGDALHLHFEFPNAAYYDEDYPVTITLTNVSDITLYNIKHMIQTEQGMIVYYSDGTTKEKIERSSWMSSGVVREFHPGDKIIIEASVNIFFESEIIQRELEKLIGVVDGIEQLLNAFKAIQTAIDATDALINCVSGCSKALDKFNFSSGGDMEKLELFKQLHSKITGLASSYTTSGNKTIDAAVGLANSGVNASLNAITSDPDEWLENHSVEELLGKIGALENSIINSADTSKKFNIFDSIRTAISAIPIRFVLKNVIMTEDESNTTSIPWSYSVTDASVQYFGVSNVSNYLTSLTQAALGEVYDEAMPWYLQLIPGLDDPFNQDAAIQYIQATENEIAQFKAKDATGNVTFKAWVERNEATTFGLLRATSKSGTSDFILSCDNETATYENGILTFTGDGTISVTPQGQTGGTLYIEDSEGNIYTYVIAVVEEHTCVSGERQVIIAPTADYDGFAVKCCETCGDIMEIIPLNYENCCKEHAFSEWTTDVEAICTEAGINVRECTVCGCQEYDIIDTLGHDIGEWDVDLEPTCTEEGRKSAYCSRCDETVEEAIPALGHVGGTATCTDKAICERCTEGYGEPLGHDFADVFTVDLAATCAITGSKSYHCSRCDSKDEVTAIPSIGHVGGTATCTGKAICDRCAEEYGEPLGHDYADEFTVDLAATCMVAGNKSYHCSRCDSKDEITVIPVLGHIGGVATCTEKAVCDRCTEEYGEPLGHGYADEFTVDLAVTCTTAGSKSYHCVRCESKDEITVIPLLGHIGGTATCTEKAVCERCTEEYGEVLDHDYDDDFTIDIEATCVENGSKSRHCSRCDEKTDVNIIVAPGHSFGDWEIVIPATTETEGQKKHICNVCGFEETDVIPMIDETHTHNYSSNVVAPTCTEQGYTKHKCAECGDTYNDTYVPFLGHDYSDEWTVDLEATCVTEGSKAHHCTRCDAKDNVSTIPALGHDYKSIITTAPTCIATGIRTHTCANDSSHIYTETVPATGHTEGVWVVTVEPTTTTTGLKEKRCTLCNELLNSEVLPLVVDVDEILRSVPSNEYADQYTPESWSAMQTALTRLNMLITGGASQEEIGEAALELKTSVDSLVKINPPEMCGCCDEHNHSDSFWDKIACFFCKILQFFRRMFGLA